MDYVKAFLIGGLICAIVQIFMDKTKLMPGRIMVGLVVLGCILGFLGWQRCQRPAFRVWEHIV